MLEIFAMFVTGTAAFSLYRIGNTKASIGIEIYRICMKCYIEHQLFRAIHSVCVPEHGENFPTIFILSYLQCNFILLF